MISEQNLIGWLCMYRIGSQNDTSCFIPNAVIKEWIKHGWIKRSGKRWDGVGYVDLTDAGEAVCDLNDPEWAIEYDHA